MLVVEMKVNKLNLEHQLTSLGLASTTLTRNQHDLRLRAPYHGLVSFG